MPKIRIAGIGSRDLDPFAVDVCRKLGGFIVGLGFELHSGNADGADQAFAAGANEVAPHLVHLWLPWASYNRENIHPRNQVHSLNSLPQGVEPLFRAKAQAAHPAFGRLSQGAQKLHTRNVCIVFPHVGEAVNRVLAFPRLNTRGNPTGGTRQGIEVALQHNVPVTILNNKSPQELHQLCLELRGAPDGKG